MLELLIIASTWLIQIPASDRVIDVSTLTVGTPKVIAELDLGKLKGELRQIGWSPDGLTLYIQTVDGVAASETAHHYSVSVSGGAVQALEYPPEWEEEFWSFKSDRFAPGNGAIAIELEQKAVKVKVGTGYGRPGSTGAGGPGYISVDREKTSAGPPQTGARRMLYGEAISEFVHARPIPGLMFSWGPEYSGAIAFTDLEGRLMLLGERRHKKTIAGAKEALLPAWSVDGSRLAWVQKSGRKKYTLVWSTVSR